MDQTEVLNDIISISNVSRTLINENREKINGMIQNNLELFLTRRFMLIYAEVLVHYNRLRVSTETLKTDINKFAQYLTMLNSGKLSPALIDPTHLQKELVSIQKQYLQQSYCLKILYKMFGIIINTFQSTTFLLWIRS